MSSDSFLLLLLQTNRCLISLTGRPDCKRCIRLQRDCRWKASANQSPGSASAGGAAQQLVLKKPQVPRDTFILEFPNIDKITMPYIHHFSAFCSRFLAYSNDGESNPFREELVPAVTSSPALLHAIVALAAGHMARTDRQHDMNAGKHYSLALQELNKALSDPFAARADTTLGACLLLCVYEVSVTLLQMHALINDRYRTRKTASGCNI